MIDRTELLKLVGKTANFETGSAGYASVDITDVGDTYLFYTEHSRHAQGPVPGKIKWADITVIRWSETQTFVLHRDKPTQIGGDHA